MRRLFQSALCCCLSPLLVAQQTAAPSQSAAVAGATLPAHVDLDLTRAGQVEFLSPGMESLRKIRRGRTVQFELTTDATYGNEVVIPANVPVTGVVVRVKHPVRRRHQDGQLLIDLAKSLSGMKTEVVVRCWNPADPYRAPDFEAREERGRKIGVIVAIVAVIGMYIAVAILRPE